MLSAVHVSVVVSVFVSQAWSDGLYAKLTSGPPRADGRCGPFFGTVPMSFETLADETTKGTRAAGRRITAPTTAGAC